MKKDKVLTPPLTGERGELLEILWKHSTNMLGKDKVINEFIPVEEMDSIVDDILKLNHSQFTNPDAEKTEDELDLIQFVVTLLYAAHIGMAKLDFDKWVEEQTGLLSEYYAQQTKDAPSDEIADINFIKWYSGMKEQNIRNAFKRYKNERT